MPALDAWRNFYVIVGSSAGALIGLQFVVIALITSIRTQVEHTSMRAFASPTTVYFSSVLLLAGLMNVPYEGATPLGAFLVAVGAIGVGYVMRVLRHQFRQSGYTPDAGDWAWYSILPVLSYTAILVAGSLTWTNPHVSLDLTAASAMLLLLVGVHNAWDGAVWTIAHPPSDT
jgi:hypothetical protein